MTPAVSIGSLATFTKGSGLSKSDLAADGTHPCIHYGELFTQYGAVIDAVASRTHRDLPVKSVAGDVLMPTSDVTPRGLAKASAIQLSGVGLGGDVLIIRPDRTKADPRFLAYAIRHDANQVLALVRGSTVYHLYAADMRHFAVPLLPIAEQARIADAIKHSDELIAALERTISKKQAIRQGLMQQLLTGKTRLPGFTEPWRKVTLAEVAIVDPEALSTDTDPRTPLDYISLEDVERGELLGHTRVPFGSAPSRARRIIKDMDVLFGTVRPNLQSHAIYRGGLKRPIASTGFAVVRASAGHSDPQFLFYVLMSHLTTVQVDRIIAGSNYPAVSSGDVRRLTFNLPRPEEQRTVGSVLADCDEEVSLLKRRLAKALNVKQGMMQELLTGRTRLPVKESAV